MLEEDDVAAKNALENYLYDYGTAGSTTDEKLKNGAANMPKTDENGHTFADDLGSWPVSDCRDRSAGTGNGNSKSLVCSAAFYQYQLPDILRRDPL